MRKLIVIGTIVVVLVAVFILVLVNLGNLANRNKDYLLSRAEQTLGRKVSVDKIGVTLRGGLGIQLDNLSVADDPAFSSEPFIESSGLQINAKLFPLLRREFQVKRLVLRDPVIRVIRNETGDFNVTSLSRTGGAEVEGGTAPIEETASAAAAPLIVSLVNIDAGTVHFVDRAAGLDVSATQVSSKVENLELGRPVSITLGAAVFSESKNLTVRGTFGPVAKALDLDDFSVDAELDMSPLEFARLQQALPRLREALPADLRLEGAVSVHVQASGPLSQLDLTARLEATDAEIALPERFQKPKGVAAALASKARLSKEKVALTDTEISLHTLQAGGGGEILLGKIPSIQLTLNSNRAGLSGWEQILPRLKDYGLSGDVEVQARVSGMIEKGQVPAISGEATFIDAGASVPQLSKPIRQVQSTIAFTARRAEVGRSSLRIGDSEIQGTATIESFDPMTVSYRATSPSLSLDDVRPPNPKAKKPEVLEEVVVRGRITVDTEPVNRGRLSSLRGSFANMNYRDLRAAFTIKGNETQIDSIELLTLDGTVKGSGTISMDKAAPGFRFRSQARGVDLVQLFEIIPAAAATHLTGRANVDLNISGSGKEWADIQPTISGDGLAVMFEGALLDLNIFNNVLSEITRASGFSNLVSSRVKEKYPRVFKTKNTEFEELKSTFLLENGALTVRNLNLSAADYAMKGRGGIDLKGALDLLVTITLSKTLTADLVQDFGAAAYLANAQNQIEVPFRLAGTLPKARVEPDQAYLKKVLEKALLKKGFDLFDKKGLKDLLGTGRKQEDERKDAAPDSSSNGKSP